MQTLVLEVFGPLIAAVVLLFAVLGVRGLLRQFGQRQTPQERQAARDAFRNRLIHPNAEQVEQGIGGFLPERLLAFYQDHPTVLMEELEITRPSGDHDSSSEWIEAFLPLDLESQKFTVDLPEQGWGKGFCFATDGAGNFYWVPMSEVRQRDAPVFFACHDPHGNEQVAGSIEEFLSWPRTSQSEESESKTNSA
jgi:hypothetical protein